MFLNRHSITQEIPFYHCYLERLPFARYPGMLHDTMRLHIVPKSCKQGEALLQN